ncbi:hypothetical protein ACFQ60_37895 [Streptomyces zhihengii]
MRLGKHTQEWLMCAVAALSFADRPEAAARWCDHWLEEARARKVPLWAAEFASLRAGIALRQGDLSHARMLSEAALAQVPADSWGVCIGGPLANLVQAATAAGDFGAAAEYVAQPVPEGMYSSRFGLYYLHARGCYHLETGRPYAALDDFSRCGELMTEWGLDQPTLVPWRSSAARAHLALSDLRSARELAHQQLALAGERPPGRAASRCGSARRSPRRAARTAAGGGRGDPPRLRRPLPARRGARRTLRRVRRVRPGRPGLAALKESERLRRECGVGRPAPVVHGTAGVAEPDGAAFALLSWAERRVVALAAHGRTNREIAGP